MSKKTSVSSKSLTERYHADPVGVRREIQRRAHIERTVEMGKFFAAAAATLSPTFRHLSGWASAYARQPRAMQPAQGASVGGK